jgi:hypothetical protein
MNWLLTDGSRVGRITIYRPAHCQFAFLIISLLTVSRGGSHQYTDNENHVHNKDMS